MYVLPRLDLDYKQVKLLRQSIFGRTEPYLEAVRASSQALQASLFVLDPNPNTHPNIDQSRHTNIPRAHYPSSTIHPAMAVTSRV